VATGSCNYCDQTLTSSRQADRGRDSGTIDLACRDRGTFLDHEDYQEVRRRASGQRGRHWTGFKEMLGMPRDLSAAEKNLRACSLSASPFLLDLLQAGP